MGPSIFSELSEKNKIRAIGAILRAGHAFEEAPRFGPIFPGDPGKEGPFWGDPGVPRPLKKNPDKRFSLHASNVTGAETITGDFLNIDASDWKAFHCVSFNKVLEHVEDPIAFLTKAGRILKKTGFIYLEVPDGETAILEGQNREEFFIDHHHVFSAASLVFMITNAGLTLVRLERLQEPSGKFTFVAFAVPGL